MRVFVAGASGALGTRLVPQLIDAGHEVVGTHNSPANTELVRKLGAKPVMLDLLDARRTARALEVEAVNSDADFAKARAALLASRALENP